MLFPFICSLCRRICHLRTRIAVVVFFILLALLCCVFVIPLRNIVFYPTLEYAWQEIPTSSLIRIHYSKEIIPDGLFQNVSCPEMRSPKVSKTDINASLFVQYPAVKNSSDILEVLRKRHGKFLPVLNTAQKIDQLLLYSVLSDALSAVNVRHFFVGGSLLGLMRHRGIIPWDDDLDISVCVKDWEIVKQTLACVKGFSLALRDHLHWKFHYNGSDYPFVDIFFYQMDESYVWSLTYYIRKTFIYPSKYVFPLGIGTFEGLRVPIPGNALAIARRIYDYDVCAAYPGHVEAKDQSLRKEHPCGFTVDRVDCKQLSYMYKMFHLKDSP